MHWQMHLNLYLLQWQAVHIDIVLLLLLLVAPCMTPSCIAAAVAFVWVLCNGSCNQNGALRQGQEDCCAGQPHLCCIHDGS